MDDEAARPLCANMELGAQGRLACQMRSIDAESRASVHPEVLILMESMLTRIEREAAPTPCLTTGIGGAMANLLRDSLEDAPSAIAAHAQRGRALLATAHPPKQPLELKHSPTKQSEDRHGMN